MISDEAREFFGTLGQRGWRPALIGWGLTLALVALAWVFVWRFAMGQTTLADFAALAPILAVVMQHVHQRGPSGLPLPPRVNRPNADGALVNSQAIA